MAKLAPAFHHRSEHLIVGAACKENFSGIELVKSASDRPHIYSKIIGHTKNYELQQVSSICYMELMVLTNFWGPIVPTDKIWGDFIFGSIRS